MRLSDILNEDDIDIRTIDPIKAAKQYLVWERKARKAVGGMVGRNDEGYCDVPGGPGIQRFFESDKKEGEPKPDIDENQGKTFTENMAFYIFGMSPFRAANDVTVYAGHASWNVILKDLERKYPNVMFHEWTHISQFSQGKMGTYDWEKPHFERPPEKEAVLYETMLPLFVAIVRNGWMPGDSKVKSMLNKFGFAPNFEVFYNFTKNIGSFFLPDMEQLLYGPPGSKHGRMVARQCFAALYYYYTGKDKYNSKGNA